MLSGRALRVEFRKPVRIAGHGRNGVQIVIDDVSAIGREQQAVGIGLVLVLFFAERAVLQLTAWVDLLVLIRADQAVAGHQTAAISKVAEPSRLGDQVPFCASVGETDSRTRRKPSSRERIQEMPAASRRQV